MYKLVILLALPAIIMGQQVAMQFFHLMDADGDWELTHAEVDNYFRRFDADGDGAISRPEFTTEIVQEVDWAVGHEDDLYNRFDFNGDHHLDHTDFDFFFTQHDTDGDGFITVTEFLNI